MKVTTSVTIPDYVYDFYIQGATQLKRKTPEELMEIAIEQYAGIVAEALLRENGITLGEDD